MKPDKAKSVEMMLIRMAQSGQITGKVSGEGRSSLSLSIHSSCYNNMVLGKLIHLDNFRIMSENIVVLSDALSNSSRSLQMYLIPFKSMQNVCVFH